MEKQESDTPRTDSSLTEQEAFCPEGLLKCSRELEKENATLSQQLKGWLISRDVIIEERDSLEQALAASEAEVERLTKELAAWDYGTRAKREQARANKAEAEVERLSKLTEDCLNVIRVYCPKYYQDAMERFKQTNK